MTRKKFARAAASPGRDAQLRSRPLHEHGGDSTKEATRSTAYSATSAGRSWCDMLPVHPAADLFPPMSPQELLALGQAIKKRGLTSPIAVFVDSDGAISLLDGRNRLDAMELVGVGFTLAIGHWGCSFCVDDEWANAWDDYLPTKPLHIRNDPYAFVASVNLHRRHLTAEQKREVVAKLIKAMPEKSALQISKIAKSSAHTVIKVRDDLVAKGDVCKVQTSTDTKGRRQPARKPRAKPAGAEMEASGDQKTQRGIVTGVKMSPHAERGLDCYETPPVAVRALLDVEQLSGMLWEPACGPGSIVTTLRAAGHHVVATDIESYGCPDSLGGVDFLKETSAPKGAQTILTNPPFMHADAFVRHALTLVPRVIMLLRLAFLEGQGRSDILDSGQLARVYVFRNRLPMMHRANWDGPKIDGGAIAYAWFIWDRSHNGATELKRLSWKPEAAEASVLAPPPDDNLGIPDFLRRATP
jgi:predicted RNA methylase